MIGYDSTNPANIPHDAKAIFPYADGKYAWSPRGMPQFAKTPRRFITVLGNYMIASICDVERGDLAPDQAATFVFNRRHAFPRDLPTPYVNRSNMEFVERDCFDKYHLRLGTHYRLWVATLDGTSELPDMHGIVAVQYYHDPADRYDMSIVYDQNWPHKVT